MQTTIEPSVANQIIDLWFARQDVFPFQWFSPSRQIGGYAKACQQQPPWSNTRCLKKQAGQRCGNCGEFQGIAVTPQVIDLHLKGAVTLGSYQLALDGISLKWACLDFDDHGEGNAQELQDAARVARMALADLGLPGSIEASGGTGWRCHLWLFFAGLVPAIKARVILDHVLRETGLLEKPFIERFPKQSRALNGYGNLVKVPFGIHRKSGKRSCFLDAETLEPIPTLDTALASIHVIDPIAVDFAIDVKHLTLEEMAPTQAQPARNFDFPPEQMHKLLTRCWWFRDVERQQMSDQHRVDYEDWWVYVLALSRFGDTGASRILAFSRYDERYDEAYTIGIINYIREHGYHMPSCRRLRQGPGQIHCPYDPMECGAA